VLAWAIMGGMSQLHAAAGAVVLGTSAVLALVALGAVTLDRAPWWLDRIRLALTGLAVMAAAIGVALALSGSGPSHAIHWLYGVVIVALPIMAANLDVGGSARRRSAALGLAGVLMALIAWRLASTG